MRATVASWPAVEGAEGEGGGGRERTVVSEVSGSPQRSVDGVVLMEQEGPAWTEIVWDEVSCLVVPRKLWVRRFYGRLAVM